MIDKRRKKMNESEEEKKLRSILCTCHLSQPNQKHLYLLPILSNFQSNMIYQTKCGTAFNFV